MYRSVRIAGILAVCLGIGGTACSAGFRRAVQAHTTLYAFLTDGSQYRAETYQLDRDTGDISTLLGFQNLEFFYNVYLHPAYSHLVIYGATTSAETKRVQYLDLSTSADFTARPAAAFDVSASLFSPLAFHPTVEIVFLGYQSGMNRGFGAYDVGTNGSLTQRGTPVVFADIPHALAFRETSNDIFSGSSVNLRSYHYYDDGTFSLVQEESFATHWLAMNASQTYLYVGSLTAGMRVYAIDSEARFSQVAFLGSTDYVASIRNAAVTPNGRFIYLGFGDQMKVLEFDGSSLTERQDLRISTGYGTTNSTVIDAEGRFLYSVRTYSTETPVLYTYRVDSSNGSLTLVSRREMAGLSRIAMGRWMTNVR